MAMTGGDHEPMTVRDHLRVLYRRRWAMLLVVALFAGGAAAYVTLSTPVYEARAQVVVTGVGAPRSAVLSAAPMLSMLGEPLSALGGASLATQRQIIESRPSLESARGLMEERPDLLQRLLDEGMSDRLFEELPQSVEALPPPQPPSQWPEQWQKLLETLTVMPLEDSEMLEIRCESSDRERAQDFVNALVLAYLGRSLADAQATTRRTRYYVQEQIADIETRLAEAEASLRQFGERVGTVALDEAAKQQIGLAVRLSEQAAITESTVNARGALQQELAAQLEDVDGRVLASTVMRRNPEIADLQQQLARAEAERAGLLEDYVPEALPVRRATAAVEELRGRLEATAVEVLDAQEERINPVAQEIVTQMIVAEGERLAAEQSLRVLRDTAGRIERDLSGLPESQVRLLRLEREIALLERIYLALKEKEQEYEISERAKTPASRLVAHAVLPDEPVRPRPLLTMVAALVAGLLLGLLAVGLAEHLDERLHEPEQVVAVLGLPLLGVLRREWSDREAFDERTEAALLAVLRQVRVAAQRSAVPPMMVLAESEPCGDAVKVARGLAKVAAREGRRTVVVAGEGRRPDEAASDEGAAEPERQSIVEVGLRDGPTADGVIEAIEQSGADLAVVVAPPGTGLLEVLPVIEAGAPVALVVSLRRTTRMVARGLRDLARDREIDLLGVIATGAARSSAEYRRPEETSR